MCMNHIHVHTYQAGPYIMCAEHLLSLVGIQESTEEINEYCNH